MAANHPEKPSSALHRALRSVLLYERLDLRLLPGTPTPRQCEAGARAAQISAEEARAVYMAMVDMDATDDP